MRPHILLVALVMLFASSTWVDAQIKLPVFEDERPGLKNVVYKDASGAGDFQHGRLVRLTMNGDSTVKGILVRTDRKNGRVFVRTEAGAAPVIVSVKDVKKMEKGVIREVSFDDDVYQPEIQQLVIFNSGKKSVRYIAPTLSSGEMARLTEMEAAENELARLEYLASVEERVLENDVAMQAAQRRTQELISQILWRQMAPSAYNANVPPTGVYVGSSQANSGQPFVAEPWPNFPNFGATPLPFVRMGAAVFPRLPVSSDALVSARRNFMVAQNFAIFERGRLVAVIAEEPTK